MSNNRLVNVAIQLLPMEVSNIHEIVDIAIEVIQAEGIKYQVCPFETVIECSWDKALQVISDIKNRVEELSPSIIINLKMQTSFNSDVTIDDKIEKYS